MSQLLTHEQMRVAVKELTPAGWLGLGVLAAMLLAQKYLDYVPTFPLSFPVRGRRITGQYGYRKHPVTGKAGDFHRGIDFAAVIGEPIYAPADGLVLGIDKSTAGGHQLLLRHPNGWHTGYAHLSRYAVETGQSVQRGQVIAYAGNSGRVTGPHLHFVVSDSEKQSQNPLLYLPRI